MLTFCRDDEVARIGTISEHQEFQLQREELAREARDAAEISEFKVSGSLRGAWHDAQRKDESLASIFKKTVHPYRIAGDGLLERESPVEDWPDHLRACSSKWSGCRKRSDVEKVLLLRRPWWRLGGAQERASDVSTFGKKRLVAFYGGRHQAVG